MIFRIMRKQILSLAVALLIGSTVCMAQNHQKGKADREKRIEKMVTDLGLNESRPKILKLQEERNLQKINRMKNLHEKKAK